MPLVPRLLLAAAAAALAASSAGGASALVPPGPRPAQAPQGVQAAASASAADRAELDAAVSRIRRRYVIIERGLRDYVHDRRTLEPGTLSADGGTADGWFSDAGLRKITAVRRGESGRVRQQLYYWGDTLIFAYEVEDRYERPVNAELATSGDTVRVASRAERRFYFADTALVGWIGARRSRGVQPPSPEAAERAAVLRREGAELRALFKGPQRR